jgi:hypothetical protein
MCLEDVIGANGIFRVYTGFENTFLAIPEICP